jgi:hypothetical protein
MDRVTGGGGSADLTRPVTTPFRAAGPGHRAGGWRAPADAAGRAPADAAGRAPADAAGRAPADATLPVSGQPGALAPRGTGPGGTGPGRSLPGGDVLQHLAADPRLGWWSRRAVLSATAGAAIGLLAGWPAGLAAAVAAGAADALLRLRTSPVIPAPVRAGAARRRTRRRLARLTPSGYLALHARAVPGTPAVIDHLVAGPAGVFAIVSQRWDRRLPVRASHGGELFHGPFAQAGRLCQIRLAAGRASSLIGAVLGQPVQVRPVMVIYGPRVPWGAMTLAGVDVLCGRRLRWYLRRQAAASRGHRLTERQAELIHAAAARALPPADRALRAGRRVPDDPAG